MARFKPFFLPLTVLAAWAVATRLGMVNPYLLPPPHHVWEAAVELASAGLLHTHILTSLGRVLAGFMFTALVAIPLAVIIFFFHFTEGYLRFVLEFIRNTPPLATVPLLILWFGIGETPKLAVIILASFFPIFLNTLSGLRQTDRGLIEMADTLDLNGREKLRFVLLPGALPEIITGLRLGFGYSWRALIGAELIAASAGLGYMILDAEELARTDIVFVGIITIGTLGYMFDSLFRALVGRCFFYRRRSIL